MWYRSIPPLAAMAFALILGLVVIARAPRPVVNRAFLLAMAGLALQNGALGILWGGEYLVRAATFAQVALVGTALQAAGWYWVSVGFARGGHYRLTPRERWVGTSSLAVLTVSAAIGGQPWVLGPELYYGPPEAVLNLGPLGRPFFIWVFLILVWSLLNVENVYRNSAREVRWRTKFFVLGMGGWLVYLLARLSYTLLFGSVRLDHAAANGAVAIVCLAALAFAILRYRLLEVEVFISRYVVYNSLTILFVGGYLVVVGLMAQGFQFLGRRYDLLARDLFVFVALLFLAAVLLSEGLRRRLGRAIAANFYRHRYDYQKEWLTFTRRLSGKISVEEIIPEIMQMVVETLWVNDASLWLVDEAGQNFTLMRVHGTALAERSLAVGSPVPRVLAAGGRARIRVAPDEKKESLPDLATTFAPMRVEMAAPLMSGGECIGLLTIGPEISGSAFGDEDAAILDALAGQGASALRSAMLAEKLASHREVEAFHRVSSFLVHDLKNFAHMLALIVQNAKANIGDPEFQRDAMGTIAGIVAKMRDMTTNLRGLAEVNRLELRDVELVGLLREVLARVPSSPEVAIEGPYCDRGEVVVRGDREELAKVFYNLCNNGREAIDGDGRVSVAVHHDGGEVAIEVADTGAGMSPQFMERELFRPFRTTKKAGLGIGAFQSRAIVEAHGGQLRVESRMGEGTTFTVHLPMRESPSGALT
jgi:putative PEP-CTERM system histidine kinase